MAARPALQHLLPVFFVAFATCGAGCPRKDDASAAATTPPPSAARPPVQRFSPPTGDAAVLLYTASVQGYVEPCGCTAEPLGGVARLKAAVDEARAAFAGKALFVDGGDLLFEHAHDNAPVDLCQAQARVDLLLDAYAKSGLKVTTLGPLDDVRGGEFRDSRMHKANITTLAFGTGTRASTSGAAAAFAERYLDQATNIGVLAVNSNGTINDEGVAALARGLSERAQALRQNHARAVVLLSQTPRAVLHRILSQAHGIDVAIVGQNPGETPAAPERIANTTVVASGQQAQHLGIVEFYFGNEKSPTAFALDDTEAQNTRRKKTLQTRQDEFKKQIEAMGNDAAVASRRTFLSQRLAQTEAELARLTSEAEAHSAQPAAAPTQPTIRVRSLALTRSGSEDSAQKTALEQYSASIPSLVSGCEANITCPAPSKDTVSYMGASACTACHAGATAFWQQQTVTSSGQDNAGKPITRTLGHARAWETLVAVNKVRDRSCVGCHSAGFAVAGGACTTTEIVSRGLQGVQCESCHGPGSVHVSAPSRHNIVAKPGEETCRTCHKVPHIATTESFVFADKLKHIVGPGHGQK